MKLFLFAEDVTATQKTLLFSLLSHFQLQPHGLQRTSLPWPSLSPGVCSISCPLSQWRYPTISFSVALFSFCPQSFPASGSFPVSWLFISGGQIYWRFSISPSSDYSGLISFRLVGCDLLAVQETLNSLFQHHSLKTSILWFSAFFAGRFFTIWAIREAQEYWSGGLTLLKGIFSTQEFKWGFLLCRWILYQLS